MADTIERVGPETPLGEVRLATFTVTMDGTEATFTQSNHGFSDIKSVMFNNESSEGDGLVQRNYDGAAEAFGTIYMSGFTTADVVTLTIIGS